MSILTNLQTATIATFVDLTTIGGLAIVNTAAAVGKAAIYPMIAGNGMISTLLISTVEGTHDLARYYYMKTSAGMPVTSGQTGAG